MAGFEMKLWLVRHGETVANKSKLIQGQEDGELTVVGKKQAQLLGKRLALEEFDAVYVSDLGRTRETFAYLGAQHKALCSGHGVPHLPEPQFSQECRERNAGAFEGLPFGTSDKEAAKAGVVPRDFRPPEGESWADLEVRAGRFLDNLVVEQFVEAVARGPTPAPADGGLGAGHIRVLVVTHGGFIKEFINAARPEGTKLYPNVCRNTSVFQFEVRCAAPGEECAVEMVVENDVQHLPLPSKKAPSKAEGGGEGEGAKKAEGEGPTSH